MVHPTTFLAAAAILAGSGALAHPGKVHEPAQVRRELAARDLHASRHADHLSQCASSPSARALHSRTARRRAAKASALRAARGIAHTGKPFLHRRDLAALKEFSKTEHDMTGALDTNAHDEETERLFGGPPQCALTPENVIGPYWVSNSLLRADVAEDQPGVPLRLEFQFLDTRTCAPVPGLLTDVWAANATGVYSGVDAAGEGGLNSTFLRGVQEVDGDGVAGFDMVFPGHYDGRATHVHLVVHQGAQVLSNGSYVGGTVAHVGQVFFDEALREAVESTHPYALNTQPILSNTADMWAPSSATTAYDPFPQFVYLDPADVSAGLLAWITVGIDTAADHTADANAAAYLAADGGHSLRKGFGGRVGEWVGGWHSEAFGRLWGGAARAWEQVLGMGEL